MTGPAQVTLLVPKQHPDLPSRIRMRVCPHDGGPVRWSRCEQIDLSPRYNTEIAPVRWAPTGLTHEYVTIVSYRLVIDGAETWEALRHDGAIAMFRVRSGVTRIVLPRAWRLPAPVPEFWESGP